MARIKIDLPPTMLASVSVPVRITDINYGDHVGNNALVEIIHEARVQFLKKHGFTELDIAGTSLIISELLVVYKNESFYNDLLEIGIYCGEVTGVAFELYYKISTRRDTKEILIALAKTGLVCFNYKLKKVSKVPDELRAALAGN